MEHSLFAPLLGERFKLQPPEGAQVPAELLEARALGGPGPAGGRVPFSLLFKGPTGPALPQQIYRVTHPRLEAMDIFLVPVEAASDGVRYEAIFN